VQDPRRTGRILLLFPLLTTIFADYWAYSQAAHRNPEDLEALVRGVGPAPQQYRIGVLRLAEFASRHSPLAMRHSFTLIDLAAGAIAIYVLFSLLVGSEGFRVARSGAQWLMVGSYTFLVQLYFSWVLWYQRPETLTTAASAALLLWLLMRREGAGAPRAPALLIGGTLLVAFLQALVRPDVVITLELGVAAMCVLGRSRGLALPRWVQAGTSVVAVLLAGAVQFYIIHRMYPHASYGDTPVFEWKLNIADFERWPPFFLALAPYLWLVVTTVRRHRSEFMTDGLSAASVAIVPGSVLMLLLFLLLGRMDEVRIFLPYALALAPMTAIVFAARALPEAASGKW